MIPFWFFSFSISFPSVSHLWFPLGSVELQVLSPHLGQAGCLKAPADTVNCTRGLGARLLTGSAAEMWREAFHREPLLMKSPSQPAGRPASAPAAQPSPRYHGLPPQPGHCLHSEPVFPPLGLCPLQLTPSRRFLCQTFPSSVQMHHHCFQRETKQKTS